MSDIEAIIHDELVEPKIWPFVTDDYFRLTYNPFQDKLPDPKAFVGYEKQLHEILRCIRTKTNVFVTGPIGVGKTAMLKSIHEFLVKNSKDYQSCFVRVEKARFEKELAKEMLVGMGANYSEYSTTSELYKQVMEQCEKLYNKGITTVCFMDDIMNASPGALRQILYLIPDVVEYQPVMVFNGSAMSINEVKKTVPSLLDRVGEFVYLEGLQKTDLRRLVNARTRLSCSLSDWNHQSGCGRLKAGKVTCSKCLGPYSGEVVDNSIENVGPFPRNLLRHFKIIIEEAAIHKKIAIDEKYADSVSMMYFRNEVKKLVDAEKRVVKYLLYKSDEASETTLNGLARELAVSQYTMKKIMESLVEKHFVIFGLKGDTTLYKLTPEAHKAVLSAEGF